MFRRNAVSILLGLAGAAWCAAQGLQQDMGVTLPERLANVSDGRTLQMASVALMFTAGSLLVLAAIELGRRLPTGRGARLVKAGGLLIGLGGVWLAAGRGAFSLVTLHLTDSRVDIASATAALDADAGFAMLGLMPTLPALILGPGLLGVGIGLHGRKLTAWLPLALWVAGIAVFLASEFTFKAGEVAGVGLAGVGLLLLGIRLESARANAGADSHADATRHVAAA